MEVAKEKQTKEELKAYYIEKYQLKSYFEIDPSPYMQLYHFKKGHYIIREDEEVPYLLFFVEGRAKVYSNLSNGKALLIGFYSSLRLMGDVELYAGPKATCTVQVISDAYCVGIPMKQARLVFSEDTSFLRYVCQALGEKLERSSKNSSINLLYPLENRLASYIFAMVGGDDISKKDAYKSRDEKMPSMYFKENLTELAELLGTSYRHLLRTLNDFLTKGILEKQKNCYRVLDLKQLEGLASDLYR